MSQKYENGNPDGGSDQPFRIGPGMAPTLGLLVAYFGFWLDPSGRYERHQIAVD